MATDDAFASYICGQVRTPGITKRKMFGEYAVYAGEKVVALIADNQLYVKPTDGGAAFIGKPVAAPPYPGAKNYFLIDDVDDPAFLSELIRITEREVPAPKVKKAGAARKPRTAKKTSAAKNAAPAQKMSAAKNAPAKRTSAAKKAAPGRKAPRNG